MLLELAPIVLADELTRSEALRPDSTSPASRPEKAGPVQWMHIKGDLFVILFVDLVSDNILQMVLGSNLLRKFRGRILHTLLSNTICYTLKPLAAMPLSTKKIAYNLGNNLHKGRWWTGRYLVAVNRLSDIEPGGTTKSSKLGSIQINRKKYLHRQSWFKELNFYPSFLSKL